MCLWGEPQWGVVGDTFPVGCAYSKDIVFPEYFKANPDIKNPLYQTKYGVYEPNCGLENVHMSFGHDGYIGEVMKNYMPEESLYMLRYHSFYSAHRHGAYRHLMNDHDIEMLEWVNKFNVYDLYSKGHTKPNVKGVEALLRRSVRGVLSRKDCVVASRRIVRNLALKRMRVQGFLLAMKGQIEDVESNSAGNGEPPRAQDLRASWQQFDAAGELWPHSLER